MQTGVVSEYGKRDRENYRVASGRMMTVTVPGGGDGGERVPLLVITTFVASTARGAGRSLFRGSLVPENCKIRFPRFVREYIFFMAR